MIYKQDIAILGCMGSGKSTIAKALSEKLNYTLYEESFEGNPYLSLYYDDPKRYALANELWFLREKATQHFNILCTSESTVQDSPLMSVALFSKAMLDSQCMTNDDYKLFMDIYDYVERLTPPPNLIVKLDVSLEIIVERVKSRGRPMESQCDGSYLESSINTLNNANFTTKHIIVDASGTVDEIIQNIISGLKGAK